MTEASFIFSILSIGWVNITKHIYSYFSKNNQVTKYIYVFSDGTVTIRNGRGYKQSINVTYLKAYNELTKND